MSGSHKGEGKILQKSWGKPHNSIWSVFFWSRFGNHLSSAKAVYVNKIGHRIKIETDQVTCQVDFFNVNLIYINDKWIAKNFSNSHGFITIK